MKRPYFKYKNQDLRVRFEDSKDNKKVLEDLLEELKHRNRPTAIALRKEVQERLETLSESPSPLRGSNGANQAKGTKKSGIHKSPQRRVPEDDAPKKQRTREPEPARYSDFKLIEPIGRARGHPPKRVFTLKEDITLQSPPNSPLHQVYAAALRLLIEEMKRKRIGARKLELENGRAVPLDGREMGYQFHYEDSADLFEGAAVTARIGTTDSDGHVVAVTQGVLIVSLEKDFGPEIRFCVLLIDNTAMLEALAKRLDSITESKEANFNYALALAAVTDKQRKSRQAPLATGGYMDELNERQQAAVRLALSSEISYIWGPPGTGKTKTLTSLIQVLFQQEKRVLICSNTNQAVDQVLLKLCEVMGVKHPAVDDGRIIRIGRIANEELDSRWSPYVTVSGVAERKSIELIERREQLEAQVGPLRERVSRIDGILLLLDQIDSAKEEERQHASHSASTFKKLDQLEQSLRSLEDRIKRLDNELMRVKDAGFLKRVFMRSEESILKDHRQTNQRKSTAEAHLASAKQEEGAALEAQQKILNRLNELTQAIPPDTASRKQLGREKDQVESKLQPLLREIAAINKKLADMELAILQNALIVGATVTKTYLSPTHFTGFDVVIVDDASMVILPGLYCAIGLAGEAAVISGDFRQLPPIVQTKQKALLETLGSDVFKAAGISAAVESGVEPPRLVMLNVQYRMQKTICDLISSVMYQGGLRTQREQAADSGRPPAPFDQTLTIIDTSRIWPFCNRDAFKSKYNLMHSLAIRNLCLYLAENNYIRSRGDVGIATPYSAQGKILRSILEGSGLEKLVSAGTVHRYQGDEKRLMILDIPDSLGEYKVGSFLEADTPEDEGAKLFNVGISRSKDHLVVVANLTYLQDKLPDRALLRDMLYTIQSAGRIVDVHEVLAFRPVMEDLAKLQRHFELDLDAEKAGLFRQKDFEAVCRADIENARKGVAIFSGFVTPRRVAAYGDLFRLKISQGVTIRCVTRPPANNGSIPEEQCKEALDELEGVGCIVDARWSIHEKVVIVDEKIVWFGSLNMLSHTARTDEMMMRIENPEAAAQVALFMTLRRMGSGETTEGLAVKKENPRCPKCERRTYYVSKGKYGPFWSCEECDWKHSFDKPVGTSKSASNIFKSDEKKVQETPKCPKCGQLMVVRNGPRGAFFGCPGYPRCKGTRSLGKRRNSGA
ncbi:MAG: AAA domain-containing protein [Pseudomonadota bacterium]